MATSFTLWTCADYRDHDIITVFLIQTLWVSSSQLTRYKGVSFRYKCFISFRPRFPDGASPAERRLNLGVRR